MHLLILFFSSPNLHNFSPSIIDCSNSGRIYAPPTVIWGMGNVFISRPAKLFVCIYGYLCAYLLMCICSITPPWMIMYECVFAEKFFLIFCAHLLVLWDWLWWFSPKTDETAAKCGGLLLVVYGGLPPLFVDTQRESQPSPASLDNSALWCSGEKLH